MKRYEKPVLNIIRLESEEVTSVAGLVSSNYNTSNISKSNTINTINY